MKVLGIDPGTAACGYGIVHGSGGRLKAVEFGWWQTPARERPELRLKQIHDAIAELIERHEPEAVVLEESFVGADARTALSVGQARGAVLVAAASVDVPCTEYAPSPKPVNELAVFQSMATMPGIPGREIRVAAT